MSARKSAAAALPGAVMAFVEDVIFRIIFIVILYMLLLLLFYCIVFLLLLIYFIFGKMKWWAPLLVCAWGLLTKARNSKMGLDL